MPVVGGRPTYFSRDDIVPLPFKRAIIMDKHGKPLKAKQPPKPVMVVDTKAKLPDAKPETRKK